MASRKEEKERLRQARLEAEKRQASEEQRRLMLGYLVAGLLAAAVLAGLVIVLLSGGGGGSEDTGPEQAHIVAETGTPPEGVAPDGREGTTPPAIQQADLEEAAKVADCDLQLDLPDEGNSHLKPNEDPPEYETNPATSGDHIVPPLQASDGAYADPVEPINAVHSLEHGRVIIQYDPELPESDQLMLKGVFDESPAGMLMFPNPDMPYEVAVTAWTQLAGCKTYSDGTIDVIRDFRDTYRGQGPEPVPF
jgi:hypothetical protein